MYIVKIGNVELTESDAMHLYNEHKYIVTHSKIYQLHFSKANNTVYGSVIYRSAGMLKPNRFCAMDAKGVNWLVGSQLVIE